MLVEPGCAGSPAYKAGPMPWAAVSTHKLFSSSPFLTSSLSALPGLSVCRTRLAETEHLRRATPLTRRVNRAREIFPSLISFRGKATGLGSLFTLFFCLCQQLAEAKRRKKDLLFPLLCFSLLFFSVRLRSGFLESFLLFLHA